MYRDGRTFYFLLPSILRLSLLGSLPLEVLTVVVMVGSGKRQGRFLMPVGCRIGGTRCFWPCGNGAADYRTQTPAQDGRGSLGR